MPGPTTAPTTITRLVMRQANRQLEVRPQWLSTPENVSESAAMLRRWTRIPSSSRPVSMQP